MEFKDFISDERILQTLEELGFTTPTPIQAEAIPKILQGGDFRASSETGTGKTAAFLLPALIKLIEKKRDSKKPRVLVLVPTRELAMQLTAQAMKFSRALELKTVTLYGGVSYYEQNRHLGKPHDILIATPGRLIDHLEQRRVDLSQIEMLILDEADRMLDMGFIGPVKEIASKTPSSRQTLMFSATFGKNVLKLSNSLLRNPGEIQSGSLGNKLANIEHHFFQTKSLGEKQHKLESLLEEMKMEQVIVFSSTKINSERLAKALKNKDFGAAALHGDMSQAQRTKTIHKFRESAVQILVATDVAARGIDVLTVTHVINFDAPRTLEDYIHRVGRTGRAGNKGVALSFFSDKDYKMRREIEKFSGVASNRDPQQEGNKGKEYKGERDSSERKGRFKESGPEGHHSKRSRRFDGPGPQGRQNSFKRNEEGGPKRQWDSSERSRRFDGPRSQGRQDSFKRNEERGPKRHWDSAERSRRFDGSGPKGQRGPAGHTEAQNTQRPKNKFRPKFRPKFKKPFKQKIPQ